MNETPNYAFWHVPLSRGSMTMREAAADLARISVAAPEDIPLMVRLAENPKFNIFHGSVTLATHDAGETFSQAGERLRSVLGRVSRASP